MEINIKRVNNGFLVHVPSIGDEILDDNYVIEQEDDTAESERKALKGLLENIANNIGFPYDKFSSNNLEITFDKKGHKI